MVYLLGGTGLEEAASAKIVYDTGGGGFRILRSALLEAARHALTCCLRRIWRALFWKKAGCITGQVLLPPRGCQTIPGLGAWRFWRRKNDMPAPGAVSFWRLRRHSEGGWRTCA